MVYKRITISILFIFLLGVFVLFAKENKQNCIIFWDYNPELSIDYLTNHDFIECKKKFTNYIKIDFSEIQEFNKESQVFILKEKFDTLKLGDQYKNSKDGKLFVSIVN